MSQQASAKKSRIYVPSGAICGIDGLKGLAQDKIRMVRLTTKKPASSFKDVEYVKNRFGDVSKIKKDAVLFSGNAQAAVKFFPQNINVAAVLSIAGIGAKRTMVRIIASPKIKRNIHEIEIDSTAGSIFTRAENIPHPGNPKTSFLAVLSALAVLKQIFEPIRIGS